VCVDEVRAGDAKLGFLLDVAVSRALVVAELALGGLLAERLRHVDGELIQLHTTVPAKPAETGPVDRISEESLTDTGERWVDRPTIPFMRPDRPVTSTQPGGVSNEVMDGITKTLTIARARTSPRAELVKQVLEALEAIAADGAGNFASAVLAAREVYGVRSIDDAGITPLYDALDQARIITAASVHQIQVTEATRAKVLRALSTAHQRLVGAATGLVLESVMPFSDRLREVQGVTSELRDEVANAERRRAQLEHKHATSVDQSLPWGNRGNTEW
jgi:hypothetical protein